jgi:hypothetical protein
MFFYMVTLLITIRSLRHFHPSHSVAVLFALLPALPIIACIASVALYLRDETDEFQRSVMIQMLLWALACTLTTTSIWGFLEMYASAPPMPAFWIFVMYSIFVAVVGVPIQARYRSGTNE